VTGWWCVLGEEPGPATTALGGGHRALRADCARCFGLCCVAPAFSASADFAIDKPAGQPCPHLHSSFRCGIHDGLRRQGFPGCAAYDCFGAGQQVSQVTFAGRDWRQNPQAAAQMFAVFAIMRQLHELLWYLVAALALAPARAVHGELRRALTATQAMTGCPAEALLELDIRAHRDQVNAVLARASELARAQLPGGKGDYRGRPPHAPRRTGSGPGAGHAGRGVLSSADSRRSPAPAPADRRTCPRAAGTSPAGGADTNGARLPGCCSCIARWSGAQPGIWSRLTWPGVATRWASPT
jgi:hypothetical protein